MEKAAILYEVVSELVGCSIDFRQRWWTGAQNPRQ
jgi:hypothetical protein